MRKEIIIATYNDNKKKELEQVFGPDIRLLSLNDIGFDGSIVENGNSFIENALIKCKSVHEKTLRPVIADDSGLCVKQLAGGPGILSARYGGKELTDKQRYEHLLSKLDPEKELDASFVCALALYVDPARAFVIQEDIKGIISFEPRGNNGFGYDPVFYVPSLKRTMAELTGDEKNALSHRGKAARLLNYLIKNTEIII